MKNKKAQFTPLIMGITGLASFAMVLLLVILLISSVKQTYIVCPYSTYQGSCLYCQSNGTDTWSLNTSTGAGNCYNASNVDDKMASLEYTGDAYNSTKKIQTAINIVPDFMQIIVIAIVFAALLGLLVMGGIWGYNRIKK